MLRVDDEELDVVRDGEGPRQAEYVLRSPWEVNKMNDVSTELPEFVFNMLIDQVFDFYGVDNNCFCIGMNGTRMVIEAVEDENDGYRSCLGCFRTSEVSKIFFRNPIARVKLTNYHRSGNEFGYGDVDAWQLVDVESGHVWLTVGTDHGDGYYPNFVFHYSVDESKTVECDDE